MAYSRCRVADEVRKTDSRRCVRHDGLCQPFPSSGLLLRNLDLNLLRLKEVLSESGGEYVVSYIVDSTKKENDRHCQNGSCPNWQGGLITLCTCRHDIRARHDCDRWKGNWFAGLTGVTGPERGNSLVYLMRVQEAFESQAELWEWLPAKTRNAKAAHSNRHGDVFQPHVPLRDLRAAQRFEPGTYKPPCENHPHELPEKWHKDINKVKRSVLLVGDPRFSFLWSKPMIAYYSPSKSHHPRAQGKIGVRTLAEFLSELADWISVVAER